MRKPRFFRGCSLQVSQHGIRGCGTNASVLAAACVNRVRLHATADIHTSIAVTITTSVLPWRRIPSPVVYVAALSKAGTISTCSIFRLASHRRCYIFRRQGLIDRRHRATSVVRGTITTPRHR